MTTGDGNESAGSVDAAGADASLSTTSADAAAALVVELLIDKTNVAPGEPTPATIRITNHSQQPASVTGRMTLGYADSLDRDIYLEVRGSNGDIYRGYESSRVDFKPMRVLPSMRRSLAPAESVTTQFDLQTWYRLKTPGRFEIRAVYDPSPSPDGSPTISGTHASAPIAIFVARQ